MQYAPTHSAGRSEPSMAFPPSKRMGFKNIPPNPQPKRIGKIAPWAFSSLAGKIRGRMQYAPTHSTGRKSAHWAFPPLAGWIMGRMQYAPTHSAGRSEPSTAFPPPKRMGFKNVPPNLQPTRIGKSDPWAFLSLAGRAGGRMQYAPTLPEGRKNHPWAFPSLAGRARGRMQYAPTHSTGRKSGPLAFPSLAGRAGGGYFCDLSLLIFSDHYPQTYFSFLVFRTP